MLVEKIVCERLEIYLSIDNFSPYQAWQQAGLFIFDKNTQKKMFEIDKYVRFTFAYGGINEEVDSEEKHWEVLQIIEKVTAGKYIPPTSYPSPPKGVRYDESGNRRTFKKIRLKIVVEREYFSFYWSPYHKSGFELVYDKLPRRINPEYLGIGAFHGFTKGDGSKLMADTLRVILDEVIVVPFI